MKRNVHVIYIVMICAVFAALSGRMYAQEERATFIVFTAVQDLRMDKTTPSIDEIKKGFKFFLGSNFVKRENPVSAEVSMAPLGIIEEGGTLNVLYVDQAGERFGNEGLVVWSDETELKYECILPLTFMSMNNEFSIGINVVYDERDEVQLVYVGIVVSD